MIVKLKDLLEDLELGKVYTDKDRPPFQVKETLSASQAKAAHKKFKETGELPPHLKKLVKNIKKLEKDNNVTNIVVPGLEWMSKIKEASVNEAPMAFSSPEAKQQLNNDIVSMSKILGKASQQVIKIMMDGVKGGRYDAMDIPRGIDTGPFNRTHEGERPFMRMLWRKVRDGFRRDMPKGKLRK